jgi:hypothetical protein
MKGVLQSMHPNKKVLLGRLPILSCLDAAFNDCAVSSHARSNRFSKLCWKLLRIRELRKTIAKRSINVHKEKESRGATM